MTDQQQDQQEPADDTGAAPPPEADDTGTEPAAEPATEPAEGNREAARYRVRLRDTEAERDALRDRLEALQRAEAERVAGTVIARPAALWASGVTLADLVDDAGDLDPRKITAAAEAAVDTLGLERFRPCGTNYVASQGGVPRWEGSGGTMIDVITGRSR